MLNVENRSGSSLARARRAYALMKQEVNPQTLAEIVQVTAGIKRGGWVSLNRSQVDRLSKAGIGLRFATHFKPGARESHVLLTAHPRVTAAELEAVSDFVKPNMSTYWNEYWQAKHWLDNQESWLQFNALRRAAQQFNREGRVIPPDLNAQEFKAVFSQHYARLKAGLATQERRHQHRVKRFEKGHKALEAFLGYPVEQRFSTQGEAQGKMKRTVFPGVSFAVFPPKISRQTRRIISRHTAFLANHFPKLYAQLATEKTR